jgi:hypothetical protein
MNAITAKGYFNSTALTLSRLQHADTQCEFSANVSGGKSVTALIELGAQASTKCKLVCVGVNGYPDKEIALTPGVLNVIPIETMGYIGSDGKTAFIFKSDKAVLDADATVGFIKHIDAVNN